LPFAQKVPSRQHVLAVPAAPELPQRSEADERLCSRVGSVVVVLSVAVALLLV